MKKIIARVLTSQAKRYISKNKPKIVVITGSVGKTSTTQAIGTVLKQDFSVRVTNKNYNTDLGVPCSIFGRDLPANLKNPFAWIYIIAKNELSILKKVPFEILVLELGTDTPGEISQFAWLNPDIAVVTAITPEHMEYFKTIDAVAKEELSVAKFSQKTIISKDMVDQKYLKYAETDKLFNFERSDMSRIGLKESDLQVVGAHSIDSISAGIAVGRELGMNEESLLKGAKAVRPQKGRMNILKGLRDSVLVDDTYNASPEAVIAALDYLYSTDHKCKIALIGNMNELGEVSEEEHARIGVYCDPNKLDLVVTLGPDANRYTADSAEKQGCTVARVASPYKAAQLIKDNLKEDAIVLLKGSQNKVFAEEAVKELLSDKNDVSELVRQSDFWMKRKVFDQ